jgi:hypothetical protein
VETAPFAYLNIFEPVGRVFLNSSGLSQCDNGPLWKASPLNSVASGPKSAASWGVRTTTL